jgi:hypothetical protein
MINEESVPSGTGGNTTFNALAWRQEKGLMKFESGELRIESQFLGFQGSNGTLINEPISGITAKMQVGATGVVITIRGERHTFTFAEPKDGGPVLLRIIGLGRTFQAFKAAEIGRAFEEALTNSQR